MNRDLLEALSALAAETYFDALERHPALFTLTGAVDHTDDDRALLPVLVCIDELIVAIGEALDPRRRSAPRDDDLPF